MQYSFASGCYTSAPLRRFNYSFSHTFRYIAHYMSDYMSTEPMRRLIYLSFDSNFKNFSLEQEKIALECCNDCTIWLSLAHIQICIFSYILNSQISALSAIPITVLFYPTIDKLCFENLTWFNNNLFRIRSYTSEGVIVHKSFPLVIVQAGSG